MTIEKTYKLIKSSCKCKLEKLAISDKNVLMTTSDIYVDDVKKKWNLTGATIFNISETDHFAAGRSILEKIN